MDDRQRQMTLARRCQRHLHWHGPREPADMLAQLPEDIEADQYGDGGVVAELEEEVAELLGKPAAVFMPTGTMAQQVALRLHADNRRRRTVLAHHTAHPHNHEDEAWARLHELVIRPVGDPSQPITLADLDAVAEPAAALFLELPYRELGGPLPRWDALVAQVGWARERDMAVHLDGARLWESQPFYGRPHAEIAALFDTVYVSFYKGLGGVSGACLAGEADMIDRAREWRHRLGGMAFHLWPYAAHAKAMLDLRLPRMPAYLEHARVIAAALREVDAVEVAIDPPHTPMLHVALRTTPTAFRARATQLAANEGIWSWGRSWPTDRPPWQRVELGVGDATRTFTPAEVAEVFRHLTTPLPDGGPGEELVEVLDDDGAVDRVVTRKQMRSEGLRHRCTYVAVVTADGQVVVHQRADWKDVNAGRWDLSFGGICDVGEPWAEAAGRELAEEAGIREVPLTDLGEVTWADGDSSLEGRVFLARHDGPFTSPDGEAVAFDRIPLADLTDWLARQDVCPDSAAVVPDLLLADLDQA